MTRCASLLALWLAGCGAAAEPATEATEAEPTPASAAGASTTTEPEAPLETGSEPVPAPSPAALELPARSLPLGEGAVLAQHCALPAELGGAEAFEALPSLAWAGARAWLLDAAGVIHPLLDVGDEACAFMAAGEPITLGEPTDRPRWLTTDDAGHLYASGTSTLHRLTDGRVDRSCAAHGRLSVSPDGSRALALAADRSIELLTFTESGCTAAPWVPVEAPSIVESLSFVTSERVIVGGQRGAEGIHVVRPYGLDGQPLGDRVGSDDPSRADRFCYVHSVLPCGGGLCVIDGNCRTLSLLTSEGTPIGRVDLAALTDLNAPWIVAQAHIEHGMTLLGAVTPELGEPRWRGHVIRLHGL